MEIFWFSEGGRDARSKRTKRFTIKSRRVKRKRKTEGARERERETGGKKRGTDRNYSLQSYLVERVECIAKKINLPLAGDGGNSQWNGIVARYFPTASLRTSLPKSRPNKIRLPKRCPIAEKNYPTCRKINTGGRGRGRYRQRDRANFSAWERVKRNSLALRAAWSMRGKWWKKSPKPRPLIAST